MRGEKMIIGDAELIYIDDVWVAELIAEAKTYDGIDIDASWYIGEGWYDMLTLAKVEQPHYNGIN